MNVIGRMPPCRHVMANIRAESFEGIFALSKAEAPKGFEGMALGSFAWWNDFSSEQLFLYGRLINSREDVHDALINLERDLGIDSSDMIAELSTVGRESNEANRLMDPAGWEPATFALSLEIMGFDPAEFIEAGNKLNDPLTPDCIAAKNVASYVASLKSMPSMLKSILIAAQQSCGGGCSCTTLNLCRKAMCVGGECTSVPVDGPCDSLCGTPCQCNSSSPCCLNPCSCDPCCNPNDPCCGNPDRCCNPNNPCCHSPNSCCDASDPCCGNPDPCCNPDNPCCGNTDLCDPVCGDPCLCMSCNDGDSCNGLETCSGGVCFPGVPMNCDDGNICKVDSCANGHCIHTPVADCAVCGSGYCLSGNCHSCLCYVNISDTTGCPGSSISMDVTASCSEASTICGDSLSWTVSENSPDAAIAGSGTFTCQTQSWIGTVTGSISADANTGGVNVDMTGDVGGGNTCNSFGFVTIIVIDLDVDSDNNNGTNLPDRTEAEDSIELSSSGKIICVNDDDDDNNGIPDNMQEPPPLLEDDLIPIVVEPLDILPMSRLWHFLYDPAVVQVYGSDRATIIPSNFDLPSVSIPSTFWLEGISTNLSTTITAQLDSDGDGIFECTDSVLAMVIRANMDAITSGIDPVPFNPAIVAPMTPLLLDDGELFGDANTFALTTLQPNIDLTTVPVTWEFNVTSGFINPTNRVIVAPDMRSARLDIPFPSFGNLGAGRMEFRIGNVVCAQADTMIKNVQPDLEPGDFRFLVKAHLTTDGMGNGTTRTAAEIRTIMSDVTKVMSQCGIIVTIGSITTTTVSTSQAVDLGTILEWQFLFATDEDETAIDIYFVEQIEEGNTRGFTVPPFQALTAFFAESGIAIADSEIDGVITGQEAVRVTAHELTHYLLNHFLPANDHVGDPKNLMFQTGSVQKRDLNITQCLEIRNNHGVD